MRAVTVTLVMLAPASVASDQYTVIDDFESYTLGSIYGQGGWMVQRNSSDLGDPGSCTVVDLGGNKVADLMDRDIDGEIDTVYASLDLGLPLAGDGHRDPRPDRRHQLHERLRRQRPRAGHDEPAGPRRPRPHPSSSCVRRRCTDVHKRYTYNRVRRGDVYRASPLSLVTTALGPSGHGSSSGRSPYLIPHAQRCCVWLRCTNAGPTRLGLLPLPQNLPIWGLTESRTSRIRVISSGLLRERQSGHLNRGGAFCSQVFATRPTGPSSRTLMVYVRFHGDTCLR